MQCYLREGTIEDLETLYPIIEATFLAEELKSEEQIYNLSKSGNYKVFLLESENDLLGFACMLEIEPTNLMWMDYFVVCEQYRNKGIGTKFMRLIIDRVKQLHSILLEVEIPNSENDSTLKEQLNRIEFYEKFGGRLVLDKYLLPHADGGFPMWLYCIPCTDDYYPSKDITFQSISYVFDIIHSDIPKRHEVLREIMHQNKQSSSHN